MKDICVAGIISYNPDISRLLDNIRSICNQVTYVIVIDNGSDNFDTIRAKLISFSNVILHAETKNKGIAWALNRCFQIAAEKNAKWVLTLDQDSVCPADIIDKYNAYLSRLKNKAPDRFHQIAILCPTIIDRNVGTIEGKASASASIPVNKCITSGAFTSCEAWKTIGGFDEKMFIDGVDFEFCDRLVKHGYYIIRVADVRLLHELGQMRTHKFLLWKINVKNHPAFRKYYIIRNRFYVARKHKQPFSVAKAWLSTIKALLIVLLYETEKKAKCQAIQKGIHDSKSM